MKYLIALVLMTLLTSLGTTSMAASAHLKRISPRKPQQAVEPIKKEYKNLKPLLVQWSTDACEDPIDQGYVIIHDPETIISLKAALKKKALLDDALVKRLELFFDKETNAFALDVTEININLENARQYFYAKNKYGHPEISDDAAELLSIINGNKVFKQFYYSFNLPSCN